MQILFGASERAEASYERKMDRIRFLIVEGGKIIVLYVVLSHVMVLLLLLLG